MLQDFRFCFEPWYRPKSPAVIPLKAFPRQIQELVMRAFHLGTHDPKQRPTAQEWKDALRQYENNLTSCRDAPLHQYDSTNQDCPYCQADRRFKHQVVYTADDWDVDKDLFSLPQQKATPPVKNNPYINIPSPVVVNSQPIPQHQPKISSPAVSNFGLTLILTWMLINLIIACFFMYLNNWYCSIIMGCVIYN